uniref:Uncharacterized protein n=1 Tax=Clytia hemisphaerica TaxID=252671 RepID=A0A7M5XMJ9_9CNID
GYICDNTGCIKLVLWREYAGNLESHLSYMLCNVKKILWNNGIESQSTSSTAYREIEQVKGYIQPDDEIMAHLYNCSIIASKIVHTAKCLMCDQHIVVKEHSKNTVKCPSVGCGATTMISKNEQNYWRIIVNSGSNNIKLDIKLHLLPNLKIDQMQVFFLNHKFDIDYCSVSGTVDKIVKIENEKKDEEGTNTQESMVVQEQGDMTDDEIGGTQKPNIFMEHYLQRFYLRLSSVVTFSSI